jgi:GNAT superfamily N-acetyltransferase
MSTPPRDVRIVVAEPGDAAAVFTMVRELAAHEGSLEAVTSDAQRWEQMLAHPDVTVLIAVADDEPVGFVSAVRQLHLWSGAEIVALDDLYVRSAARNRGVGEALMLALAERSGALPIRWEVEEGNLAGQRFYLRLGARLRRKVVAWWNPTAFAQPRPRPTS